MLLRVLVASCAVVLPFVTTPADGLAGLEHYESCEQCVAAGLGWSPNGCRCGGFANRACSGTASDCHTASAGPALPFYAARFPKAFPASLLAPASAAATELQLAGSISCGDHERSGDTSDVRSGAVQQLGHDAPDMLYRFVVRKTCTVTVDLCESEYDSAVRVLSADGLVEYARNDDDVSCCDRRDDKELRSAVNMHCPYSKIQSLELEPGEYVVQVEGYSRYEGKFNLKLLCESSCV